MARDRDERGRYNDQILLEDVLEVFSEQNDRAKPLTTTDIAENLQIARRTAHKKLSALVDSGALESRKVGANGRVWWVPLTDYHAKNSGQNNMSNTGGRGSTSTQDPSKKRGREYD